MDSNKISYKGFGSLLVSRLQSREIYSEFRQNLDVREPLYLDFSGVTMLTTSFATELMLSVKNDNFKEVHIVTSSEFVKSVFDFAMKDIDRQREKDWSLA